MPPATATGCSGRWIGRGLIELAPADVLASSAFILGDDEDIGGSECWRTSVDGRALAKARIGKPMRRDEAERRLTGVIDQAREVNRDPSQLFCVESIELFGSLAARMLTTSATSTFAW